MNPNRFISILLTLTLLITTLIIPVMAEQDIKVVLNEIELSFDVPPQIIDGRTMVPMRVIFEALGADVYWIDGEYDQMILAVKNEIKIIMSIDGQYLIKFVGDDFEELLKNLDLEIGYITLDVPPQLVDGRTLVPARAVSEALGVDVEWSEETSTVILVCDDEFIQNKNANETFYLEFMEYIEGEYDDDLQQRVYVDIDTNADMMIISTENENPQKSYVITDKKEIEDFLSSYEWRDWHWSCCWEGIDPDYTIKFIYGDVTKETIAFKDDWTGTPYNPEFGVKLKEYMRDFKNKEDFSYQYVFYVKNSIDSHELKQNIYDNEKGNIAYLPNSSINATKPYIELSYIAVAKDKEEWDKAFYGDNKIGEFEYDDYFIPFIDELKAEGLYFDNDKVSFSSGNGLNFSRRVKIFLTRSLTENEITEIKEKSKKLYIVGDPQRFHPVTSFRYNEVEEYEIKVIFDKEQNNENIKAFCKKYNVDSFDYDKELLDFDNMTIYMLKNTVSPDALNPTDCKSLVITEDLDLIYRQHEPIAFVPFKDADPPSSIIEQRKISKDDYQMIRRIISNYEILSISDNLGFGDYEFDRFCYIGIQIDSKLFVCGGQDPYSHNERFFNIRSKILRILNIDS